MRRAAIGLTLVCAAGGALAQSLQDTLTDVTRCVGIADSAARLQCYDAAVPRMQKALAEQEAQSKRSFLDWFGFGSPPKPATRPEDFGKPAAPYAGEVTQLTAVVTEFARTPRGKAVFILDNGQVWRQLDSDTDNVWDPIAGKPMKVTIEAGTFGGYNLSVEGRAGSFKVRRLR